MVVFILSFHFTSVHCTQYKSHMVTQLLKPDIKPNKILLLTKLFHFILTPTITPTQTLTLTLLMQ